MSALQSGFVITITRATALARALQPGARFTSLDHFERAIRRAAGSGHAGCGFVTWRLCSRDGIVACEGLVRIDPCGDALDVCATVLAHSELVLRRPQSFAARAVSEAKAAQQVALALRSHRDPGHQASSQRATSSVVDLALTLLLNNGGRLGALRVTRGKA